MRRAAPRLAQPLLRTAAAADGAVAPASSQVRGAYLRARGSEGTWLPT